MGPMEAMGDTGETGDTEAMEGMAEEIVAVHMITVTKEVILIIMAMEMTIAMCKSTSQATHNSVGKISRSNSPPRREEHGTFHFDSRYSVITNFCSLRLLA